MMPKEKKKEKKKKELPDTEYLKNNFEILQKIVLNSGST